MTNDEYKLIKRNAYARAMSILHHPEVAEDMAHDVVVKYLEYEQRNGKRSRQTISQAMIDCERDRIGRAGSPKFENRPMEIQLRFNDIIHMMLKPPVKVDPEILVAELMKHLSFLSDKERLYVELALVNYPNSYIFKLMGISEGRLSQIRRSAIAKIKDSIKTYGDITE